jgi:molybdate transport system substrate-binding protein
VILFLLLSSFDLCAASSLQDVAPKLKADAQYRFESSAKLSKAVEAGAHCDVVLLADDAWASWLAERKLVHTPVIFASNRLVIAVPKGAKPLTPDDLVNVSKVALAGEAVPAGRYAKAALAPQWNTISKKIIRAENVRMALQWVARKEADAGIVYATDVRSEPLVIAVYTFPVSTHPKINLTAAATSAAGDAFVTFLRTPGAQKVLSDFGFLIDP